MSTMAFCSAATLAKLFLLSERRIRQLSAQGVIPKPQDSQYSIMGSVNAYVLFLRDKAKLSSDPDAVKMARERLRWLTARADRADYENQMLREAWVDASAVQQTFQEVGAVFTACVDALPGKYAHELVGITDPAIMKARLFEACRGLRNLTAEGLDELEKGIRERAAAEAADQSASAADTGSVGE